MRLLSKIDLWKSLRAPLHYRPIRWVLLLHFGSVLVGALVLHHGMIQTSYGHIPLYISLFSFSVLVYCTVFILDKYISTPLRRMVKAVNTITTTREFSQPIEFSGPHEITTLVQSFNVMVQELSTKDTELKSNQEALENLIAERTIDLVRSNTELLLAKEKAESAAHSKSVFLSHMSSSLRTPLNGILIYTELLSDSLSENPIDTDLVLKDLTKIQVSANQLLRDIDKVLEYAQVEVGQATLRLDEIILQDLVSEIAAMSDSLGRKRSNKNEVHQGIHNPHVFKSDLEKLRQILFALVDNAHKYTSSGIITTHIDADNESLIFTISDTGCGISPEKMKALFGGLTNSIHKGDATLGLSLTLAKRYTDLLGGSLSVKSQFSQGSVFTLKLPINPTYTAKMAHSTVLLMTEGTPWQDSLLKALTKHGLWTVVAHNFEESNALVQALHPKIVVVRVDPDNPVDWAHLWKLKKVSNLEQTRFIIIAESFDGKGFISEAREVVMKPVVKDRLARLLSHFSVQRDRPYVHIIEDDRVTALLLSRQIESLGWSTHISPSAEDALDYLDANLAPSLILLDLGLPGMSGLDFAQEVSNRYLEIPVVVVTGKEDLSGDDFSLINSHEFRHLEFPGVIPEICRLVQNLASRKN